MLQRSLTYPSYADYVVAVALDENGHTIGKSRPVHTIPAVGDDQSGRLPPSSADMVTEDKVSSSNNGSKPQETSQIPITWIVLFVVGFVTAIVICATIWAVRHFKGKPWWRTGGSRYEAGLPNEEDPQDEAKIPLTNGDPSRDDE